MSNAYLGDYEGPSPAGARIDWQGGLGNWGIAHWGDDRRAIVNFHKQSIYHEQQSIAAGRRIYVEQDFVSIQHPGEREQKIDRPVQETDKHRWPMQWMQYLKREEQTVEGTPIDLLFPNHPGIADNLKASGVLTVEQLANLSATGMQNVGMGAQDYVNYARSYLEHAQKGVGFHRLNKELQERDAKIDRLEKDNKTLMGQLDQLLKQNAAIIAATPAASAAIQQQSMALAQAAAPAFSMPPIPAKMPDPAAQDRMAKARAAKAAKKVEQEQEQEPANAEN